MGGVINRPDVLHLFTSQHWVASIGQLRCLGVSTGTIQRAKRAGVLEPMLPGIVRVSGTEASFGSRAMSLQLHVGAPSFISGVSAGVLHGLRQMPHQPVEITTRQRRHATMPSWGRLVYTSWIDPQRDVQTRPDGIRVASPLRMLFRLAAFFNQHRFERAAEDCWHLGLVTPSSAADYLAEIRRSGRGGVIRFEDWLVKVSHRPRPSQSALELDVLDAIRRAGLPEPERQYPLTLRTGEVVHVDLAWPRVRLGVEPGHSWWHGGDLRQRADQARDRACDEIGWRIVRCDESVRGELAAFGLQLRIIYDERLRSLRAG
jgi:hypothetical protein